MLAVKSKQALVLNLRNPAQVLACIPRAKTFKFKGQPLLAVPHGLDEARVLNNMGIRAPSPIRYYYDWPKAKGRFDPMKHQIHTAEFLTLNPWCFCLNGMGTAKTMSALWAADYLMKLGLVRRVLIVAPLSTLDRVWGDEIFLGLPHRNFSVIHGSRERRLKLMKNKVDFYIINHDGIGTVAEYLIDREDIDLVIIDELAVFRTAGAARYKVLEKVLKGRAYVWGMTGSPTPNAPTDAYAQARLINKARAPKYFGQFRDMVMRQQSMYKWVARPTAMQVVYDVMQPSIRYNRADCIDIPSCMTGLRHVEMSPEQKKMYKDMANRLKTEYMEGQVTAVNESVKTGKLLQIAAGVAYAKDGTDIIIPSPERLSTLMEIIESAEGKVIVYVPLTGALNRIRDHVAKTYGCECVDGSVSMAERSSIFSRFQQDKDMRVLVAHPKCMAHGLTLTEANVIVWYIPTNDNEVYEQANARITRPGQTRNQFIIGLEGSPAERVAYKRLDTKGTWQGSLLEMFESP